jgi:septal ring factor EnvC (AmiA/AmiB activator)
MRISALTLVLIAGATSPAFAQSPPPDLDAIEDAAIQADLKARELRHGADTADRSARAAEAAMAKLAARIQENEGRMTRIERKIERIRAEQRQHQAVLAAKQSEVTRLLAALQTLSRRPTSLVLLQPESAVTTARVAAILSAVRPVLAERTATLRTELDKTRRMRALYEGAERRLARAQKAFDADVKALAKLQVERRAERDRLDAAADKERARALLMANRALDLRQLARSIERSGTSAARPRRVSIHAPSAAAVASLDYALPAAGEIALGFGATNDAGVRSRGVTLATRKHAQVTAPAAGRVAYAGEFRNYGDIVIIEHEGSMLSLISGLGRVDVGVGEKVGKGAPIGRMGAVRPKLYLELRQDGRPVDPALWLQSGG